VCSDIGASCLECRIATAWTGLLVEVLHLKRVADGTTLATDDLSKQFQPEARRIAIQTLGNLVEEFGGSLQGGDAVAVCWNWHDGDLR
jgi:hypothetical protein